jgi:hypothetical protein
MLWRQARMDKRGPVADEGDSGAAQAAAKERGKIAA